MKFLVYIALGLLLSLQPPFYPSEAEAMGATPAEYGFVFGIANLSLFVFRYEFGTKRKRHLICSIQKFCLEEKAVFESYPIRTITYEFHFLRFQSDFR
jgi:hypothetical protein